MMSHVSPDNPWRKSNLQTRILYTDRVLDTEVPLLIWTIVEINLSIVSACLPTLRPLFLRLMHGKAVKSVSYPTRTTPKVSKQSNDESARLDTEVSRADEMEIDVLPIERNRLDVGSTEHQRASKVGLAV